MRSCMCLPIRGRGRVINGVMTLIAGRSRAPYGPDDLALAEELTAKAALAIENAHLYREAQDAIRAREEFLMVASHELRTPLTSLNLNLHKLRRAENDDAGAWRADDATMDAVARQIDRLADLVSVLFDGSVIPTRRLHLDRGPADLVSIVESVADRLRHEAGRVGCSIRVHARAPATGDWDGARATFVVKLPRHAPADAPKLAVPLAVSRALPRVAEGDGPGPTSKTDRLAGPVEWQRAARPADDTH